MSFNAILHSGPVAIFVLVVLLTFSIVSWAIVLIKYFQVSNAIKYSSEFSDVFWKIKRLEEVKGISSRYKKSPLVPVFMSGFDELNSPKRQLPESGAEQKLTQLRVENLEHALRKSASYQMRHLESFVPFLATVSSTSPFIGLFGTVVGIMNSFAQIGLQGSASLATVAPGMAEALVATAAGLLAAIPAAIAYNYFASKIRFIGDEMNIFVQDFINLAKNQH